MKALVRLYRLVMAVARITFLFLNLAYKKAVGIRTYRPVYTPSERVSDDELAKDYDNSLFKLTFFKAIWRNMWLDIFKEASLHHRAPNPKVRSLDGTTIQHLLDFQKAGRPLVLNFGSCS